MAIAVVAGAIANKPQNGGAAWTRLSWALGLRRLGFDVHFLEQVARDAPPAQVAYFESVTAAFGLAGSSALIIGDGEDVRGAAWPDLLELAAEAELLVNISGHLALQPLLARFRRKVYVDLDPGFTQLWHAAGDVGPRLERHDLYLTIGENVGTEACPLPTNGVPWRPTRQPVVLEHWPPTKDGDPNRFTTVGSWRGPYGPVEHDGRRYGLKVHEFRKLIELPRRAPQTFELALDIHPAEEHDLQALASHGWRLADPKEVAGTPEAFRSYVQGSGAEFSVAQGIYVETACGWFSDRTARYLASGKPVLVQETGFSRNLPTGEGLLAFRTLDEAVAGAEAIAGDYEGHTRAARRLAEEYFDSDKVLARLLEEVGVAP